MLNLVPKTQANINNRDETSKRAQRLESERETDCAMVSSPLLRIRGFLFVAAAGHVLSPHLARSRTRLASQGCITAKARDRDLLV